MNSIVHLQDQIELKNKKQYKDALVLLYKALEFDDNDNDNVELLSQIGQLHLNLYNFDRALEEFQRALAINPKHTYSLQKCFEVYYIKKQYQKALSTAQKLCEEDKSPLSYYCYLKVLIETDKNDDAI